jgi:hypothetical protein
MIKGPKERKLAHIIVESLHFSTMAINYHWHFAKYSKEKKHMMQFIPKSPQVKTSQKITIKITFNFCSIPYSHH